MTIKTKFCILFILGRFLLFIFFTFPFFLLLFFLFFPFFLLISFFFYFLFFPIFRFFSCSLSLLPLQLLRTAAARQRHGRAGRPGHTGGAGTGGEGTYRRGVGRRRGRGARQRQATSMGRRSTEALDGEACGEAEVRVQRQATGRRAGRGCRRRRRRCRRRRRRGSGGGETGSLPASLRAPCASVARSGKRRRGNGHL